MESRRVVLDTASRPCEVSCSTLRSLEALADVDSAAVDGNDPLAVYLACAEARKRAVAGHRPVLIEVSEQRRFLLRDSDDNSRRR